MSNESGFIRNYRMGALAAVQQVYICPRTSVATAVFFTRSGVFLFYLGFWGFY